MRTVSQVSCADVSGGDDGQGGDKPAEPRKGPPPPPAEYRWKKGQSGNPNGRLGWKRFVRELKRLEPKAWKALEEDLEGESGPERSRAIALVLAYRHGKPTERVEHTGEGGGGVVVVVQKLAPEEEDGNALKNP